MGKKEAQTSISRLKVGLLNVCSLFCEFYYVLLNIMPYRLLYKYTDLIVESHEECSQNHFLCRAGLLSSNMNIHCGRVKEEWSKFSIILWTSLINDP